MSTVIEGSPTATAELSMRALTPKLGAEIFGYDFSKPPVASDIAQIRGWLNKHYVVLFRYGKRIMEDEQVAFSEAFGPLNPPP